MQINKLGQARAWAVCCVHLLWYAAWCWELTHSLHVFIWHQSALCLRWRRQTGASVPNAYSSLRQKENILSVRLKHHLELSTESQWQQNQSSRYTKGPHSATKKSINKYFPFFFIRASDLLNTFKKTGTLGISCLKTEVPSNRENCALLECFTCFPGY